MPRLTRIGSLALVLTSTFLVPQSEAFAASSVPAPHAADFSRYALALNFQFVHRVLFRHRARALKPLIALQTSNRVAPKLDALLGQIALLNTLRN